MPRKIIIDTDPGVDDAMAILFALRCPELDVVGLTTVFGNVDVDLATTNALHLAEFDQRQQLLVARGAEKPLEIPFRGPADFVHGDDGFGNTNLPAPTSIPIDQTAAEFIVDKIMSHPGEITLVPIGPLTNIALALELEPRIVENVAEIVLMGGAARTAGNVSPVAEANIHCDPHAADKVFTAGWPVTMIGLDVTTKVITDEAYLESLRTSRAGDFIFRISRFYQKFHEQVYGISAIHTHDPSAIAYLIRPELFKTCSGAIRVPLDGLAMGQTIWDERGDWIFPNEWSDQPKVNVCLEVDDRQLLDLMRERLLSS
ncbi:MAG: inosine-uridine nucleoside N-ribohydrolase [Verrucomicrobiales bacterium]|jgi:inosine-uridine nucleoside N-ribohydrolase